MLMTIALKTRCFHFKEKGLDLKTSYPMSEVVLGEGMFHPHTVLIPGFEVFVNLTFSLQEKGLP